MKRTLTLTALALFTLIAGCAAAPLTEAEFDQPFYTLELAQRSGAMDSPAASRHVDLAIDHVSEAAWHLKYDQPEAARADLVRAQSDAELALQYTRLERTNAIVVDKEADIIELREDAE